MPCRRVAVHDRPVPRLEYLDVPEATAAHVDPLAAPLRLPPAVRRQVPGPLELLQVQVLRVGVGVGDRPGHPAVVTEVREPGQPWEGRADHVEVRAGQLALPVHVGGLERPVRVVAQHGRAVRGPGRADRPRVRAGLGLGQEPQVPRHIRDRLVHQPGQPPVRRDRQRRARGRPDLQPAERLGTDPRQQPGLGQLLLPEAHQDVPYLEGGDGVPGLPRLDAVAGRLRLERPRPRADDQVDAPRVGLERRPQRRRHGVDVAPGRGGQAHPPGQDVLPDGGAPGDLGPAPAGPPPVVVHLEHPVLRARVAHAEPGVGRRLRPNVRYAVIVPDDDDGARLAGQTQAVSHTGHYAGRPGGRRSSAGGFAGDLVQRLPR